MCRYSNKIKAPYSHYATERDDRMIPNVYNFVLYYFIDILGTVTVENFACG